MAGANITRRLVLSTALLAGAGIALSGCTRRGDVNLDLAESSSFGFLSSRQAALLTDVADIMIPRTETVGATDTKTILYLDQLLQTWASAATKLEFERFIDRLDARALEHYQTEYLNLSDDERRVFLSEIDAASFSESSDAAPLTFYRRVKWLIFHIHYTSEASNPDFVLIPGQYRGDVSETEYSALVAENRY